MFKYYLESCCERVYGKLQILYVDSEVVFKY